MPRLAGIVLLFLLPTIGLAQSFTVPLPAGDVFVPNDMPPDETGGG